MTTNDRCHADLKLMADAVEITSPTQYRILGEPRDFSGAAAFSETERAGDGYPETPVFLSTLEGELYSRLYVRPAAGAGAPGHMLAQRDFVNALSAANSGVGTWEPGWRIVRGDEDGRVEVIKDQVSFWVPPTGLRTKTGAVRPGDFCRVRVGKELRQLIPGFYCAVGNGDEQDGRDATGALVRIYWHLSAGCAAQYIALTTAALNSKRIPFRTKVVADPGGYRRADAGVLYLERRYFGAVRPLILDLHRALKSGLRPEVPMFTKYLAEGVGLAEDPRNGMSFGQSRCVIIARALWNCFTGGVTGPEARLSAVAAAFRREGLDPESPFLERNSTDFYTLSGDLKAAPRMSLQVKKHRAPRRGRRHKRAGLRV